MTGAKQPIKPPARRLQTDGRSEEEDLFGGPGGSFVDMMMSMLQRRMDAQRQASDPFGGHRSFNQRHQEPAPPIEADADKVANLVDMGFPEDRAK